MFNDVMHIAFFTDRMDEMIHFYTDILGGKIKTLVRYKVYLDRLDRPENRAIALKDPNKIFNVYIELAPNQYIELFHRFDGMAEAPVRGTVAGYNHFALTVDDIFKAREELSARGLTFTTEISKGPSETYQMWSHDPDGNYFEIMQFTDKSYQVVGHIDD